MFGTRRLLDASDTMARLTRFGIDVPAQGFAPDAAAAEAVARSIGFPVALKAVAHGLVHKSEAGAVRLSLGAEAAVGAAAREMQERIDSLAGFIIQAMAPSGLEIIAGMKRDDTFGPAVLVGLGGIWVEAFDDVAVRLAPVTLEGANAMLDSLRGARVLDGYRGGVAVNRGALAQLVVALGEMATLSPEIVEVDLNPVVSGPAGAIAVDARIIVDEAVRPPALPRRPRDQDVAALLEARSVAIVGASSDPAKQGARILRYMLQHGFDGHVYAVNRGGGEVLGRTAYRTVADLPEVPDLACVAVPAAGVGQVIQDCAGAGVRAAVVFSSGFSESGGAGAVLEEELASIAQRAGIAVCGPNTAGLMHAAGKLTAATVMTFESQAPPGGEIAMLSQSGAVASSLLGRTWADGTGVSHWVCSGNEVDLTIADYLHFVVGQDDVRVVAVFLEGVRDPEGFLDACRLARRAGKPVVVYKTGSSAVGARAVGTHSGALAGDDRIYDAVIRAGAAVRARGLQELLDLSIALAWQPLPTAGGLGVVSTSGGMCSVVADEADRQGLHVPALREAAVAEIASLIPTFGSPLNPVDVTMNFAAAPAMIGDVLSVLLADDAVDCGMVVLTTNADPLASAVARRVVEVARTATKPILVTRLGAERLAPAALAIYRQGRLPVYPMPERAVAVARGMLDYVRAGA